MSNTIDLVPLNVLKAQKNLKAFIERMRNLGGLGIKANSFEKDAWNVTGLLAKGMSGYVYFGRLEYNFRIYKVNGRGAAATVPADLAMREPFRSFAKAVLTYWHEVAPATAISARIMALRCLEAALFEFDSCTCPTKIIPMVMDRAVQIALGGGRNERTASELAKYLSSLYEYLVDLDLLATPDDWKSPLRNPGSSSNRVGAEFDKARQKKLPDPEALYALAEIFCDDGTDVKATFTSSAAALMLCAPDRGSELLFSPANLLCEDWVDPDTGQVGTALRWFPVKGGAPSTKTVIPSMRDIAVRAVKRLLALSNPARILARWYEKHPKEIWLPLDLTHLRESEWLTIPETYAILYGCDETTLSRWKHKRTIAWLDRHQVPMESGLQKDAPRVRFRELEKAVIRNLPPGFPIMDPATGMRYAEALCILREGEFASHSPVVQCVFNRVKYGQFSGALKSSGQTKSVFEAHGYTDTNGDYLSINPHMLRHYLNTLVRRSGDLTEEEIARWSGRRDIRQNRVYDHESPTDRIAKLQKAVGDPNMAIGPFGNIDNRIFIRRDKFAQIKIITAHVTEFGYCIHDYAQSPCQVHQDCINCNEEVCVKGDRRAEENLRKAQAELTELQRKAKEAFTLEVLGAAEWYKHQCKSLERVNQLLAIIDDAQVPEGAVIQLSGIIPPSRLSMAAEARRIKGKSVSQAITTISQVHALLEMPKNEKATDSI